MREIKFRGKSLGNGEWIVGDLIRINGHTFIFPDPAPDGFDRYMVDPATVGQFTGLLDRNGKEIWEGDIVRNQQHTGGFLPPSEDEIGAVVIRIDGGASVYVGGEFNRHRYLFGQINEVIGNIHDNPKLLKTDN